MNPLADAGFSGTLPGDLNPVIIGYGHAGRDLHHRSLRTLVDGAPEVLAVDPVPPRRLGPNTRWVSTLDEALSLVDPERAVFHVATPVHSHRAVVESLAAAGARRVIVEKPIAKTAADARRIAEVAASGVQVVPVAVWLASAVTEQVEKSLAEGGIGVPLTLHMEQSKPRFRRSQSDDAHRSALDVELPHQLLLALHLAGPVATLTDAVVWPMDLPDRRQLPGMGGARLVLAHTSGVTSTLVCDLTAPTRVRRLRLSSTTGTIVAHFPISGDDDVGQLQLPGHPRRVLVHDAPLTQFIGATYRYFAGLADRPPGDMLLHLRAAELLEIAADQARTGHHQEVVSSLC